MGEPGRGACARDSTVGVRNLQGTALEAGQMLTTRMQAIELGRSVGWSRLDDTSLG